MSIEQKVPTVGESINEVTIAQWFKSDGDYVENGEIICELESDKATFEVPADASGTLKIVAQEGDTIEIGALICKIAPSEGAGNATTQTESAPATTESSSSSESSEPTGEVLEMTVPTVGESINEVTIASWQKENGDFVENGEILCELESDKATFEVPADGSGILEIVAQEGDTIEIGALICKIQITSGGGATKTAEGSSAKSEVSNANASQQESTTDSYAAGHPSPAAAKILAEKGISPNEVKGTGVGGRITKEDAERAQKQAKAPATPKTAFTTESANAPAPKTAGSRGQERKKMSSLRKTIARRLVSVKNETAMLTTFNEVDMQPIKDIRAKYKEKFKGKHEVGLGFMSFFVRACCVALQEFPAVNAYIDGNDMVFNDFCDVSIAVSSPRGLVVPVIRNAEDLSFDGIEKEVVRLAKRARDGQLSIPEMTGGTFTITNGGIFGSMLSTPIINAPQSAILGMHNIVDRPVAINGEVKIRPVMYVALSYDHRIIDGKESVSFLYRIKELLEDPVRLLLGV